MVRQIDNAKKSAERCDVDFTPHHSTIKGDVNVVIPRRNKEPPMKFAFLGCGLRKI